MAVICNDSAMGESFAAYCGDCCQVAPQLASEAIGFSIYSPPFTNIFVYSDSEADMGNCSTDDDFQKCMKGITAQQIFALI